MHPNQCEALPRHQTGRTFFISVRLKFWFKLPNRFCPPTVRWPPDSAMHIEKTCIGSAATRGSVGDPWIADWSLGVRGSLHLHWYDLDHAATAEATWDFLWAVAWMRSQVGRKLENRKTTSSFHARFNSPWIRMIFSCSHHLAPDTHDAVRFLRIEESGLLLTEVKQTRRNSDSDFARTVLMNLDETMMKRWWNWTV